MRFSAVVLGLVLAATSLVVAPTTEVRADVPTTTSGGAAVSRDALPAQPAPDAAPRAGTDDEADDYARREAESPEVQEFVGGFIIFLLVVTVLVLLIILLAKEI
jgi:hypothetical protein